MQLNLFLNREIKNTLLNYNECNLLELFAGSRSIGNIAENLGINVFSVDWVAYEKINLVIDIGKLTIKDIPFIPNVIWCSPDCSTYSVAGLQFHRQGIKPISDYAKQCDIVNEHLINLIKEWQKINTNLIYFIENPRGMLRKMPFMLELNRYTIWYCKYGDTRAKPTDIWTNSKNWLPKNECYNNNKKCHHEKCKRGFSNGVAGQINKFERSKIPAQFCNEISSSFSK